MELRWISRPLFVANHSLGSWVGQDMKSQPRSWVESMGGPLVMLPGSMRSRWTGTACDDYRDACAIDGYAGVLKRDWGEVLVLGDEPLRTTVVERIDGPAIVRWTCSPAEECLVDAALSFEANAHFVVERLVMTIRDESYVIVDSALRAEIAPGLELRIPPGTSRILTHIVREAGNEVAFVLHRFES
ncbi:Imm21 family immunity protein [Corallococcus sp. Z5C101001]|uniref:Imm21 family immunity protein n=1 Tax=Corallococcus sp. Z5C101001 TaxID=2596829 RepID=UPI00117F97A4|nr:Imm21 family immunity protein [Corallococcus sp. Z5C101001]TSC31608.1 hypothetical protein FOF48_13180 [Corallococcus sp. Z5C101001]